MRTPAGYWAFVPRPLPPPIELTWTLVKRLSEADRALAELGGTARNLPNPRLLMFPFIRREAVLSSRIEGTQASLSDLFFFEASETAPRIGSRRPGEDVHEVANYVRAMNHGLRRLDKLPLSLRLIRELHESLMAGVRGEQQPPGQFRVRQNWIGPPGCALIDAVFVPPPLTEMAEALDAFEKYLHAPSDLPPLVRMALIHYQFEAIHPFSDGNGRVGRLLISLMLCHDALLPQPLLYLSAFFERHRDDYYRRLLAVSQAAQWADWIDFFLAGVAEQSNDAVRRAASLLDLWQGYRGRVARARASALLPRMVDMLFEGPVITIPEVARRLGITHRAASLNVGKLVDQGMIAEVSGRERNKVFVAQGIIDAIEAPLPAPESSKRP